MRTQQEEKAATTAVVRAGADERLYLFALTGGFFLLGLLTLHAYGTSWDEPLHREWGRIAWMYLRSGDEDLLSGMAGAGQYYGPLYYMLNYGVAELAQGLGLRFTAANHLLNLCTATLGVACTFLLARLLVGGRVAVAATLSLLLMPPFVAHAHYNPKDIPLLTLTVATLLFATKAYRFLGARDAALAGAFLGVAIALKPTAIVLLPIVGGAILADMLLLRPAIKWTTLAKLTALAAAACALGVFVSWPTLWRQPALLVEALLFFGRGDFWHGAVLYFGTLTPATELPWHYTPVMLFLATPLIIASLAMIGAVLVLRRIVRRDRVFAAALLLLWVFAPLLLFMKPGLSRYDGMRQLIFILPALAILCGVGWDSLQRAVPRTVFGRARSGAASRTRRIGGRMVAAATALLVVWLVAENVRVFPYGGSYANEATRLTLGPHLERKFEIEYWGVPYREGLRWLRQSAPAGSTVCVPVGSRILEWELTTTPDQLTYDCNRQPDYIMLITRFADWPKSLEQYRTQQPAFTVGRLGSDLLYIFESGPAPGRM